MYLFFFKLSSHLGCYIIGGRPGIQSWYCQWWSTLSEDLDEGPSTQAPASLSFPVSVKSISNVLPSQSSESHIGMSMHSWLCVCHCICACLSVEAHKRIWPTCKLANGTWLSEETLDWEFKKQPFGASLVAQWLRIRLPMQGTWVRALVWEDPTCHGGTKPMCHNYWGCALEPVSHNHWSLPLYSPWSAIREATAMGSPHTTTKSSPYSPQLEKAHVQQRRPNTAKN